jgi:hypothetical protein
VQTSDCIGIIHPSKQRSTAQQASQAGTTPLAGAMYVSISFGSHHARFSSVHIPNSFKVFTYLQHPNLGTFRLPRCVVFFSVCRST